MSPYDNTSERSMTQKKTSPLSSIHVRLTRWMAAIIMVTFTVIGVIALLGIRANARANLSLDHRAELTNTRTEIERQINQILDDLRRLATSSAAREFAGQTITVASTELESAQQRLLGEFVSLAQQNPRSYLELRYVTRSGSVWTRVTAYDGIETFTDVSLNELSLDETLLASLQQPSGSAIIGHIVFRRDETGTRTVPPEPMFRFSAPVSSPNDVTNIPGVVQIDVNAQPILNLINAAPLELAGVRGRRLMLVNSLGQIIADSQMPEDTYPRRGVAGESSSFSIHQPDIDQVLRHRVTEVLTVESGGRVFSGTRMAMTGAPSMPWWLLVIDDAEVTLGAADARGVFALFIFIAAGAVISLATRSVLARALQPLVSATSLAQQLIQEGGSVSDAMPHRDSEVGQLIDAFEQMSQRVQALTAELETQVGRYSRNLEIAARLGRETATLYDMDALLNRAITLIVEEFGYYHAQVFLVDDAGQNAVLFYSYGEIGQKLLEQAHKIPVGSNSVIGTVTANAQPVVVNDTEEEGTPHRFNPLLPDTRAEMAVPLQVGNRVIGALDIQSTRPNVFAPDEVQTFQLLADQIAVAIHNARLLLQTEERVGQIDMLNRQLTREAWAEAEEQLGLQASYTYDLFSVKAGDAPARAEGEITAPITIRGEVIGTLSAAPPDGVAFTEGEHALLHAVADRVALAIENARLFQQTQFSLAHTELLYRISRLLNEANSLEEVVEKIVTAVMPDAISGQVSIFGPVVPGDQPETLEITVDWVRPGTEERFGLHGTQLFLADHPLLRLMRPNQVALVNDVERDERLDDVLLGLLHHIGAGSAVFIPFSARGQWRGIISFEFATPREFSAREGQIYTTLIDQVGVAIENRLLLRQTEMTLSHIQSLYAASRIINSAQSIEDFVRAALHVAGETYADFELALLEGDLDAGGWPTRIHFVARSTRGDAIAQNRVAEIAIEPDSPLRRREPLVIGPESDGELARYLHNRGINSAAVFPLFSLNQPIALFFISSWQPLDMSADDFETYRTLTSQMSTALQNRRLLEQTEDALDESRRLYSASRAIAAATDAEAIYQAAAEHLSRAHEHISRVSVLMATPFPRPDAPFLEFAHIWTHPSADGTIIRPGITLSSDDAPFGRMVVEAGGPVLLNELERQLKRYPGLQVLINENGTASMALMPIQAGRKWLGVLLCESARKNAFDEAFMRYAQAIADQLAVAVDNQQLFEEAQAEARRALALAEAGQLASRIGGSLEESIGEVFAGIAEPASYDRWSLALVDEERQSLNIIMQHQPELDEPVTSFALNGHSNHSLVDALNSQRPIIVNDPSTYPAFNDYSLEFVRGIGRHIAVPVRIGNEVVGALLLGRRYDAALLDHRDEQLALTLAAQVGIALENRRLFRSTELALQETAALYAETNLLYQASRALSDTSTPESVLQVVVGHLIDAATTQAFIVMLTGTDWEASGAAATVAAYWQHETLQTRPITGSRFTQTQFAGWNLLATDTPLFFDDIEIDERLAEEERDSLRLLGLRSAAILPLRAGRRAIGALVLGSEQARVFSDRDQRVYRSFAEQASLKMEAARLLAQTERRARQLATSAEVGRSATTILDLDQLFPRIVDLIRDAFGYDHVQIFLMDAEDRFAELRASTGEAGQQLLALGHKLEKGSASVIGQVTATGMPSITADTRDSAAIHRYNPYLPNTRAEMAVPLIIKGRVVGALDVQSNQPNAFDEDDVAVLTTLATQISVAIDNARLFEQARRRASEMSFLFSVTTAAAAADSLHQALQNVAEELRDSLDALSVSIYLPEATPEGVEQPTRLLPVALAGSDHPLEELAQVDLNSNGQNLLASVAMTRRPALIGQVANEASYLPVVDGARSAVIVPLTAGDQLVGLITVESNLPNAYDNDTLTLLLTLSGTLSAIVQNQQLLEQVQASNEQLRTLDRLKSDFLANMSHELRTPLNSIIGFSRVILKGIDGPLTEMQEQDLTTIYTSGQHLLNLINDILDQAKISANKMELQTDYFQVKPVIDAVRSIGIGLVKDKPIDIIVELEPGLPQAYGDEFRTRQVLLNLVSNAAKFTHQGTITLKAYTEVDAETGRTMIRIDVSDTGIGISEKDLPLLFEAFRQVDSSLTRTAGGTGLGLVIAKSLCELQGGKLLVKSQVNVGSTFSVLVPTEPPATAEAEAGSSDYDTQEVQAITPDNGTNGAGATPAVIEGAQPPAMSKRQILLIEDNPDMVDQFRRILQREGFDIFTATIPLEAEAMATGLHPTVIIMDVNFGEGAGWEILERLKNRDDTADIPVIVVTLSPERQRIEELGAFSVISRPFMPEVLIQTVHDAEQDSAIDRILIIDDQPESVRLLSELLQEHGNYRVFSANNGQDGIALVARRRPDLIILDMRMPEMDGFTVAEELRANPETAAIPILVVTGETLTAEERERLRNLDVLMKTDISLGAHQKFIDGVKTHLGRTNGVN